MVWFFRKMRGACYRLEALWFRLSVHHQAWLAGGKLQIGKQVIFVVPVRIDGEGTVNIGQNTNLGFRLAPRLGNGELLIQAREAAANVIIGNRCSFSNNVSIIARTMVQLGDRCLIGDRVTIMDADFHEIDPDIRLRNGGQGEAAAVKIGANCWIGSDAMILKGVIIGDGSIIAPKSVVTKTFPARSVIAGSPAKLVKSFSI
jgi:acetyltransferase-like isoleucine patch superfamily enzyme